MDKIEKMEQLIDLQEEYLKRVTNNKELDDYEKLIARSNFFPSWWFSNENIDFKLETINKALTENKELEQLEEVNRITDFMNESKIEQNIRQNLVK